MFRKDCFGKADIKQAFFDQFGFFLEATPGWWSRADRFWPCCRAAQTNKCENRAQAGLLGWMPSLGWRPSLLGTTTLLGAPGLTRSKKLLGTKGIATRSKDATRLEAIASPLCTFQVYGPHLYFSSGTPERTETWNTAVSEPILRFLLRLFRLTSLTSKDPDASRFTILWLCASRLSEHSWTALPPTNFCLATDKASLMPIPLWNTMGAFSSLGVRMPSGREFQLASSLF